MRNTTEHELASVYMLSLCVCIPYYTESLTPCCVCSLVVVKVVVGLALLRKAHSMTSQNSWKEKGHVAVNSELFSELRRRPICTVPLK